jgi:hypothetical protein
MAILSAIPIRPPYIDMILVGAKIDDIRIYNRALTETEIQALYNEL